MPATEICTHCQSEITAFEQAFLFEGKVFCRLCDQQLRQPTVSQAVEPEELTLVEEPPVDPPEMPVFESPKTEGDFDLAVARKKRKLYLTFFVLMLIGHVVTLGHPAGLLLYFPCWIVFLIYFLSTTKHVLGYSTGKRAAIGIGLFIPGVSLILLLCIDTTLYKRIREKEYPTPESTGPRTFCSMALYSLLLLPLLFFGLPLAIISLVRIKKSDGRLYGRILAIVSLILNAFYLGLIAVLIISAMLAEPAGAAG